MKVLRIKQQMLISNILCMYSTKTLNWLFVVEIWGCIPEREMVTKNFKKWDSQKSVAD